MDKDTRKFLSQIVERIELAVRDQLAIRHRFGAFSVVMLDVEIAVEDSDELIPIEMQGEHDFGSIVLPWRAELKSFAHGHATYTTGDPEDF